MSVEDEAPEPGGHKRPQFPMLYLEKTGWLRSVKEWRPVDANGEPLPWYTFPAIEFLAPRIRPKWRVFEYGSGYSTIWWGRRVAHVASVEHNAAWVDILRPMLTSNITLVHREGEAYVNEIAQHKLKFNVVVIDGKDRLACARAAVKCLTPDGVFVWDNAELRRYHAAFRELAPLGFRRIDFEGIGPKLERPWWTSVLYRDGNCLRI